MDNKCLACIFRSKAASQLDVDQLTFLSENCASVSLKKGNVLMQQGAFSSNIAYLKKGLAKIHINGPYHEQIIKIVKAPEYLGLPNTFGDKINNYSATVLEDSEVCFIDIDAFKYLLANNEKFAYEIILSLCNNELGSFKKCAVRTQKQIRGNVADVLLDLSSRVYDSNEFEIPIARAEIANLIDKSRESVSRILNEFEKDGIIKLSGKKVEILDKEKLKMIYETG